MCLDADLSIIWFTTVICPNRALIFSESTVVFNFDSAYIYGHIYTLLRVFQASNLGAMAEKESSPRSQLKPLDQEAQPKGNTKQGGWITLPFIAGL
jgi:hypothetical protein